MSMITWITGWSPFGPIFGKELRVASRRKRNHLLRVAYLGGLLLVLLAYYASMPSNYGQGNVAYRIQQQAEMGQAFFATFGVFCICCMGLIAPVLTSTAINSEHLGKTLHVLLMTPITSWQIVSGKLFARLLIAMLLIGLTLPVLALVRLLGGVETSQMFAVICLCTVFAMSCGALGLFYSTLINRAYAVILLSYATLFGLYFLLPMFYIVLTNFGGGSAGALLGIMALNPVVNVTMVAVPEPILFQVGLMRQWIPGAIVQLGMTAVLLASSAAVVRRIARHAGERAAPAPAPQPADQTAPPNPGPHPAQASTPVGDNPVLWREIRRPLTAGWRGPVAGLIVATLLLISYAVFADAGELVHHDLHMGYAVIFNILYFLLIAILSATAIAQEKESDTWTLLLASPISAPSIVLGKLLGIARRMLWPTLLIALHFAIFTLAGVISSVSLLVVLWILITFNTVWAALGLFLSLYVRKVTTAVVINLMVAVVLFMGLPAVMIVLSGLTSRSEEMIEATGWYMPYPFMLSAIESFSPDFAWHDSAWFPTGRHVSPMTFFVTVGLLGMTHLSLSIVIVLLTIWGFDQMVGRAPQTALNIQKTRPIPTPGGV